MKQFYTNVLWVVFSIVFSAFILQGCGGGAGGGGNGDEGGSGGDPDAVTIRTQSITFNYAMGASQPEPQTLSVSFDGSILLAGYAPGVGEPSWLTVSKADTYDNSSPVDIEFSLNVHHLSPGTNRTTVRLAATHVDHTVIGYKDVVVTCVASNQVGFDVSELTFSQIETGAPLADQRVSILGNNVSWSVSADQSWVELDEQSGTTPSFLYIGIGANDLKTGIHTATVTIRDTSNNDTAELELVLAVEPHQLFVGDNGVAFASFPTAASMLSHGVTVSDNAGTASVWSATSNQAWLSVTDSGTTGDLMTLTADPTGLATDTTHFATVTVTSDAPDILNEEQISVGFYVSSSDPTATSITTSGGNYYICDPIRPYVYVTNKISLSNDQNHVDVFNIYTGVNEYRIDAGTMLETITIDSKGSTLFAEAGDEIIPIDLETHGVGASWPDINVDTYSRLEYARFNGKGVILTSNRKVLDVSDGSEIATIGSGYHIIMASSLNDNSFYVIETGLSGYMFDLERYVGNYSVMNDTFSITRSHHIETPGGSGSGTDIAVNHQGSEIYLCPGVRTFLFDGDSLIEGDDITPSGLTVEVAPSGSFHVGASSLAYEDKFSGDGLRIISKVDNNTLSLTDVAP